jgi:hypothetical protein
MIPTTINMYCLRDLILRHVRQPYTLDSADETVYSPLNKYPIGGCDLHDWTVTYNVSTSLGTATCRSAVDFKSSPSRKVAVVLSSHNCKCNYSTTAHRAHRIPNVHRWKIVHRAELCGTERWWRIRRLLWLQHDFRRIHIILHSQQRPRSSPRVTTQSQGTTIA